MSTAREKLIEVYNNLSQEQKSIFKRVLKMEKENLHLTYTSNLVQDIVKIIREDIK